MTIKNGFKSSIGWNLGKKGISNHLFDPLTSTPKKGTNIKKKRNSKNKILETLIKSLWFNDEKKIIKKIPIPINNKCLIKNNSCLYLVYLKQLKK